MTDFNTIINCLFIAPDVNILDTNTIDFLSIPNTVYIMFNRHERLSELNNAIFHHIVGNNCELNHRSYELCLFISAKENHDIFNLDNNYNYHINAIVINNDDYNESYDIDITDIISQVEKDYIQDLLWKKRPVKQYCKMQVEDAIKTNIQGDIVELYSHDIVNNEYHSVWKSKEYNACIFATIVNYNNGQAEITLEPVGYNIKK